MKNNNIIEIFRGICAKYLLPDGHYEKVLDIDFNELHRKGYKCVFFDIDNTLVERRYSFPEWKIKKMIDELKIKKWTIVMLSNNRRLSRTMRVADFLEIPCIYKAIKPFPWVYKKAFKDFHCSPQNTVCIGDQLLMDILGGNIVGCKTIYVDPLGAEQNLFRAIYIWLERYLLKFLEKII